MEGDRGIRFPSSLPLTFVSHGSLPHLVPEHIPLHGSKGRRIVLGHTTRKNTRVRNRFTYEGGPLESSYKKAQLLNLV